MSDQTCFIHPWEAWYCSPPGLPAPLPWPRECGDLLAIYYDNEPLPYRPLKDIQSEDPYWITREGEPECYTRPDETSYQYYLYPRPTAMAWIDGDLPYKASLAAWIADAPDAREDDPAPIQYIDGDTYTFDPDTVSDVGVIIRRSGSLLSGDFGPALDYGHPDEAITLVYRIMPPPLDGPDDHSPWPDWAMKYVLYGALEKLYRVPGDGRIESLARYWGQRYALGIETLKRYRHRRRSDRNVRFLTHDTNVNVTVKHPRLPDGYPI